MGVWGPVFDPGPRKTPNQTSTRAPAPHPHMEHVMSGIVSSPVVFWLLVAVAFGVGSWLFKGLLTLVLNGIQFWFGIAVAIACVLLLLPRSVFGGTLESVLSLIHL